MEPTCLNCKFCRIIDAKNGHCRVTRKENKDREIDKRIIAFSNTCDLWQDAGQQYYIRLGWLKGHKSN